MVTYIGFFLAAIMPLFDFPAGCRGPGGMAPARLSTQVSIVPGSSSAVPVIPVHRRQPRQEPGRHPWSEVWSKAFPRRWSRPSSVSPHGPDHNDNERRAAMNHTFHQPQGAVLPRFPVRVCFHFTEQTVTSRSIIWFYAQCIHALLFLQSQLSIDSSENNERKQGQCRQVCPELEWVVYWISDFLLIYLVSYEMIFEVNSRMLKCVKNCD